MSPTKTLLIIEDDPVLSDLMIEYCEELDVAPLTAFDGATGVKKALESRPAAITVDYRLPDMSGLDVIAQLSANPATRDIPAFFLSADAKTHETEARARGAKDVLQKPITTEILRATLEKHGALS
jgi:CheY-like chemotaxis protein